MFACQDVETVEYPARSFDVIWSIECTEHLFDKPRFFRRAASWLRPGGRLANRSRMYLLAPLLGPTVTGFLGRFDAILDAYRTGAMCLVPG